MVEDIEEEVEVLKKFEKEGLKERGRGIERTRD